MADLSSIINAPDALAAGQAEGVITPMAAENNQTIEQDNPTPLDGQNDQSKVAATVSAYA